MNVLFLTLLDFNSIYERNIYTDLLREFLKNGHWVYVISPTERRNKERTHLVKEGTSTILRLRIGNTQKTNLIEKGISTVSIEPQYIFALKKYFEEVRFDLVLYTTPPITLCRAVEYIKKRDHAGTYLLLKDIFPQNAVDLRMLKKTGCKGILYRYFRKKEKRLYRISERIGCMSEANVRYVLKHNPEIPAEKVEVCPNSVDPTDRSVSPEEREELRKKYDIPLDKTVFIYGGNLGNPQGIPFLIKCLHSQRKNGRAFFLIAGDGTEYPKLEEYLKRYHPKNVKLFRRLPKEDYDRLAGACDVGLIFLDHRFTIPNFPSRLLSYMEAKLPVLAVTDRATDIGKVVTEGGFGWWCGSDDVRGFHNVLQTILEQRNLREYGAKGFEVLQEEYTVEAAYRVMISGYAAESIK